MSSSASGETILVFSNGKGIGLKGSLKSLKMKMGHKSF
jgi:hypothetical protein